MTLTLLAERTLSSLKAADLLPSSAPLIPTDFAPTTSLAIAYDSKSLDLGTFLRASECRSAPVPTFASEADDIGTSYTLMLVDPDAPSPDDPKFAWWRHWVLSGLRSTPDAQVMETRPALTEYLAPGPKDDSRPHRYVFLLFREPSGFSISKEDVGGEEFVQRRSFKAAEFVAKHGLQLVGLNWMTCAGDGWKES